MTIIIKKLKREAIQLKFLINRYLSEYHYYHREIRLRNKPRIFAVELTNFCNLSCLMCPRTFMKRKIGFMDFSLFKKIMNQIRGYNGYIWLHLFGESLFHPQLGQFITYCSENNIKSCLSTNATVLNEKNSFMILNSRLDHLLLSLDSVTKETYQKIRQGGDFDKTRDNILNFLEFKKKFNRIKPFTEIQIIRMNETESEINTFKKQWENLADRVFIKPFCTWAGQVETIAKIAKPEHLYRSGRTARRYPCLRLWQDGVVLWNGDFVPCCMDFDGKMVLGNLEREKLDDIWNSAMMKRIRKEHVENNYTNPLCKNCVEWSGKEKDILYPFSKNSKLFSEIFLPPIIGFLKKSGFHRKT